MKIKEQIEKTANEAVQKKLAELPEIVNRMLSSAFLSILGLENRGSGIEIDHCNGRYNILSEVLKLEAQKEVAALVKGVKGQFDLSKFKEAFQREFMQHMSYHIKYNAEQIAKKKAEEYCNKHLNAFIDKILNEDDKDSAKKYSLQQTKG
jgi:hypothetical protein